jgi:hypothetical protein
MYARVHTPVRLPSFFLLHLYVFALMFPVRVRVRVCGGHAFRRWDGQVAPSLPPSSPALPFPLSRFFAILLLLFEIRIRKTSEGFVKKYFGFMYDYAGRTAFLLL